MTYRSPELSLKSAHMVGAIGPVVNENLVEYHDISLLLKFGYPNDDSRARTFKFTHLQGKKQREDTMSSWEFYLDPDSVKKIVNELKKQGICINFNNGFFEMAVEGDIDAQINK